MGAVGTTSCTGPAGLPPKLRASSLGVLLPPRQDAALRSAGQPLVQALFKRGIQPAWEDPANAEGGAWNLTLPLSWSGEQLWVLWHAVLQAVTSGSLERSVQRGKKGAKGTGLVLGAMLCIKPRGVRLSVWVRSAQLPSSSTDTSGKGKSVEYKVQVPPIAMIGQQFARVVSSSLRSSSG